MLSLPPSVRIFVATQGIDGRKGIDGLAALVRGDFNDDPLSGHLFVFFTRRFDRVRVLYWDRNGYCMITKRLERGRFHLPWTSPPREKRRVLESAELALILEGIDLRNAGRRVRWTPRRAA